MPKAPSLIKDEVPLTKPEVPMQMLEELMKLSKNV